MTRADWANMMESDNTDVHFVMGQREAALIMLLVITKNWNQGQREDCIKKAITAYETRLRNSDQEGFIPLLGPGFRHLCELFRKDQQFDD